MTKIKANDIKALPGRVLVRDLVFGEQKTRSGIIIADDDGKESGIHPRWAKIYKVGEGIDDVEPGEWVLIKHGRWSRTLDVEVDSEEFKVNLVDYPDGILLVADEKPDDVYAGMTQKD